ncbi:MAG: YicC family protein, partial [Verrucomicrobia bacterium]|nr:YicC family protein [Verrucomicrobiota bacterium]
MHSMTGYGRGQVVAESTKVVVEIQSVNKRQTEISISLPSAFASLENDLRAKVDRSLHRGRITVTILATGPTAHVQPLVDQDLANLYLVRFRQLQKELALPGEITIETILRSPGVISSSEQGLLDQSTRTAVNSALDLALQQLLEMRAKEGSNLHKELTRRIRFVRQAIAKIRRLQPRVTKRYRGLLFERVKKIGVEISLDDDRLTKEVAFFAERSDFSEELSRLESHLDQFIETTNKQQAIGRTLEFIGQEIGRELNTLGAKANDAEISRIVVHCKAELEKIREQVQNV